MTKTQIIKLHFRSIFLNTKDRLSDLANLFIPIFIVSGLLVGCFKFWIWILP